MSFNDIFRSSFLQEYSSDMSTASIIVYMAVAAVIGLYIFLIYRIITKKSFYDKNFNISLWAMTMITTAIIIVISSNIVLSLGMVGALSIVRYRTAIKDPMDLIFLFWALAEGIMCGAGMAIVGIILALIVTIGVFILDKLPMAKAMRILTISASDYQCEDEIMSVVKEFCRTYKVRSRAISSGELNIVIEFSSDKEKECTDALLAIEGVHSVSTLSHDGEVTY